MKIGVMGPGAFEIAPFIARMDIDETVTLGGRVYNIGKIDGIKAVAAESGICKVNTAAVAQRLISDFSVDMLAVIGVAGGMNHDLRVFDVVIPDRFAHHDVEKKFVKDYFPNTESFIDQEGTAAISAAYSTMTVDMETAAAAQVAYVNDIPFIAVRTVSDTEDNSGFGTFEENCGRAGEISAEVLIEALGLM